MIYFDVDGCFRDIEKEAYGKNASYWNEPINGKVIVQYVDEDPDILLRAPETEYCDTLRVLNVPNLTFLTKWKNPKSQQLTREWLNIHFPGSKVIFTDQFHDKMNFLRKDDILVEDYPNFSAIESRKIILIDRPYNQNSETPLYRVKNPSEFKSIIEKYMELYY